jgi:hypothetical protein
MGRLSFFLWPAERGRGLAWHAGGRNLTLSEAGESIEARQKHGRGANGLSRCHEQARQAG